MIPDSARERAVAVFALLTVAIACTWPSWALLVHTWRVTADYEHGFALALLIAVWIFIRSGDLPASAKWLSLAPAALLLVLLLEWLVAYRAASAIGQQVVLPLILCSAVWMAFGRPVAARFASPILCLYFAIPIWDLLVPVLQKMTVFVSETTLGWLGVPVQIDGTLVRIPEGTFRVAEGCAGKRYLLVALAIAALFAGTSRMSLSRALAFMSITAGLSLVMNWLRVLTIIWAGHATHMTHYLVAREHLSFGWILFAVLIAIVCLLGNRYAHRTIPEADRTGYIAGGDPLIRLPLAATLLVLCIPMLAVLYGGADYRPLDHTATLAMPLGARDWHGPLKPNGQWSPVYLHASSIGRAAYGGQYSNAEVFVAGYREARPGAKLVSSANTLLGEGWITVRDGTLEPHSSDAELHSVRAIWATTPSGQRWLIGYLYEVNRFVTGSPIVAQIAYGALSWSGDLQSRIVAVAMRCKRSCENGEQQELERFWAAMGGRLLAAGSTGLL